MSEIRTADRTDPARAEALLRACLGAFPHVRLTVTGSCMEPALREGEGVLLAHPSRRAPRFGDVVLVSLPEGLRLHRLIFRPPPVLGWPWRTKGDRSLCCDRAVPPSLILGTVVGAWGATGRGRRARAALASLAAALVARIRQVFPGGARA